MRTTHLFTAAVIAAALTGCQASDGGKAAAGSPTPTHPAPRPTATVTPARAQVLGPKGLGELRLGMTKDQAVATGSVAGPKKDICWIGTMTGAGAANGSDIVISPARGVVAIFVSDPSVRTAEGISVGSILAEAKNAYPGIHQPADPGHGFAYARVSGNSGAFFQIAPAKDGRTITQITLVDANQDCFD